MKKFKKLTSLLLASALVLSLAACGGGTAEESPTESAPVYEREDEETVYDTVLLGYEDLLAVADESLDPDERAVLYAAAEATLLDSAVFIPTSTQNGVYTISRIAPHTVPYVLWGNDSDRVKGLVIADTFLTPAERDELKAQWEAARAGEGTYDPAAWLKENGHTVQSTYTTTFSTAPVTLDWLNTSSQSDTEITVNTVDGLVEYDNLGYMQPALAESWDISEDGTVYTFHLRPGVYWYTAEGAQYAEVTAEDFVAGMRHMLDAQAGLEFLVDGVIVGATAYYAEGGSWDDVGYKAIDPYTLEVTLERASPYFMTMLTYSCFLPICDSFYQSRGGVYGVEEYAAAVADDAAYTFGKSTDPASQVYCGPYLLQKLVSNSEIVLARNPNYYKNDEVTLDSVRWVYDNGEDLVGFYNDVVAGVYAGCSVGTAAIGELAKADGNFEKYAYVSDTTATTYFGALNLNRGTYALESGAVASPQTEEQKVSTHTAMQNKNFRKALQYAFDKETWNAVSRGENALTNLRNMYTSPEFVTLTKDVTDMNGHTFTMGTLYGDIVQYYCDEMGLGIDVHDGVDGWYDPAAAKDYLTAALEELGDTVQLPINIDVVYYSPSDTITAQAAAYKNSIESVLGAENVQVNLVEATTSDDYYACGYRSSNGEAANYDMFYGSGWGPDYGDPKTYLDTFKSMGAGYMTKTIGLF